MSDNSEDNVFSLTPKLDPLKQMEGHEWGRELYKSYLISCLGLPPLAADHKASLISESIGEAIAVATFRATEAIIEMTDQLERAEMDHQRDETEIKQTAELIRQEMVRQAEGIYFWDTADQEILFQGGKPEVQDHLVSDTPIMDRFDFEEIAKKILK